MANPATQPLPEPEEPATGSIEPVTSQDEAELPPPVTGYDALELLLETPRAAALHAEFNGTFSNFLIAASEIERRGEEYIEALAEAAEDANATDYPLFRRFVLVTIAGEIRGQNQHFSLRTLAFFCRLPRGPEFDLTVAALAEVDPEAHLIVVLRLRDVNLAEQAHTALFAKLDFHGNAIDPVEPLGTPEQVRPCVAAIADELGVALGEEQAAALVRVLSYELGQRRHLWGDTFKPSRARELARKFITALKDSES